MGRGVEWGRRAVFRKLGSTCWAQPKEDLGSEFAYKWDGCPGKQRRLPQQPLQMLEQPMHGSPQQTGALCFPGQLRSDSPEAAPETGIQMHMAYWWCLGREGGKQNRGNKGSSKSVFTGKV